MLSRVAGNLYWLARYLDRAENTARMINVHGNLLLDLPRKVDFGWETLVTILSVQEAFYTRYKNPDERNVVKFLVADRDNPCSILTSLAAARENLRTTRDVVPREAWEAVNNLYLWLQEEIQAGISRRQRYEILKGVVRGIQQITGLIYGTMSHTMAYHFIRMGRYLERGDMTTRILDVRSANLAVKRDVGGELIHNPYENILWMSVLKSLTAYQMYRQHMRLRVQGSDVLRFLLLDDDFPRSFRYALSRIADCLRRMPRNKPLIAQVNRIGEEVTAANLGELAVNGLHEFMDLLQIRFAELHAAIDANYFSWSPSVEDFRSAQRQSA